MSFLGTAFGGLSNNYTQQGQSTLAPQAATANANYAQANSGLNTLAQALQQQMNGGGPNLANQQLQNATGQNVANQASLQAGQRGASSNVGLMARQAGQQGAAIQQQAAGQSATNVLQQQLAAQQQLASVYGTQGQLANSNFSTAQGGLNASNNAGIEQAGQNAKMNQGLVGGVANAAGSILGAAHGGEIPQNPIQRNPVIPTYPSPQGYAGGGSVFPQLGSGSNFGFNFVSGKPPASKDPMAGAQQMGGQSQDLTPFGQQQNQGMNQMAGQPMQQGVMAAKEGGQVPGEPKQPGRNVPSNDTVPAVLTPKEVVLPLSVTQSKNPPQAAAQFMQQVMAGKHKAKK